LRFVELRRMLKPATFKSIALNTDCFPRTPSRDIPANAPVEQAPSGLQDSNGTTAPTGSGDERPATETVVAPTAAGSQCDPFREIIVAKCELGPTAKRIHQDRVADHGFSG